MTVRIARVQCSHRIGLGFIDDDGGLSCLPCYCNEPTEVLETFIAVLEADTEEIGGDECGGLLPGDENLPLALGAEDPDLYADVFPTTSPLASSGSEALAAEEREAPIALIHEARDFDYTEADLHPRHPDRPGRRGGAS